jgi:predicted small integral membrane protein
MTVRLLKLSMVFAVGVWALLIAADNLLDYESNWQFVRHVLSMDTVFPDNALKYRAITNPLLQTIGYWLIISTEWVMSAMCLAGTWTLFKARRSHESFARGKPLAANGLGLIFLLYFAGFVMVGGEWFCMWQSQMWNGQAKAFMFLSCAMLVLIVLLMREDDDAFQAGIVARKVA